MDTMTLEEYHALMNKKTSKYGNIRTQVDGIWFDSQAEAKRYGDLKYLKLGKLISDLKVHPTYNIGPNMVYEADFEYLDLEHNRIVVEDVKGTRTGVYRLKKKLFLQQYPQYEFKELSLNEI